ncbi:uncharacterized protein LOC116937218 isoform X2 [Petromyzon marinus]|uniref:uncharacterized protein LOC116937218 isoform X2 n=1 Tax=Petromyzon marinus TaxID=7757 RepID=UPI003F710BD8
MAGVLEAGDGVCVCRQACQGGEGRGVLRLAGVFALSLASLLGLLGLALGPRLEEARRLGEALTQIQPGDNQGCGLGSLHARLAQLQSERRAHLMRLQQPQRAARAEPAAGPSPRGARGNVLESVSSRPGKLGDGDENHGGVGVALAGSWENPAVNLKREEVEFWPSQTQTEIGGAKEDASWEFSWDPASTRAAPARSRDLNLQRRDPSAGGELLGDIPAESRSPTGDTIENGAKGGGGISRPTAARKLITSIFGAMFEDCGSGEGAAENGADVGVSRSSFRANSSGGDVLREYSLAADRAIDWAASVRALHRNQHLRDALAYRALLALRELAFRRALAEALSLPAPGAAATAATGSDYFHVAWSVSPHFARCAEVCYAGGRDSTAGVARERRERSRDCRSAGPRGEAILPAILSGRDCSCSPDGEERPAGRAEPALLPVAALERCLVRRAAASLGEMRRDVLSGLSLLLVLALASCAAHALALSSFARVTAWLCAQARRLAGRTRRLRAERARAEELLHEMLPRAVAAQLRTSHHVQAESFDKAGHATLHRATPLHTTPRYSRATPYRSTPHHATPRHTTQHHTTTHHTTPHHTTPHHATPRHTTQHHTTPHHTTPHHTTPHHTTPHHTTLHYTTLHHTTQHHTVSHCIELTTPQHHAPHRASSCLAREPISRLRSGTNFRGSAFPSRPGPDRR